MFDFFFVTFFFSAELKKDWAGDFRTFKKNYNFSDKSGRVFFAEMRWARTCSDQGSESKRMRVPGARPRAYNKNNLTTKFPTFKKKLSQNRLKRMPKSFFEFWQQKNWKKNFTTRKNSKKCITFENNFFITFFFILRSSETYARKNLFIGSFWGWGSADR